MHSILLFRFSRTTLRNACWDFPCVFELILGPDREKKEKNPYVKASRA